MYVLARVQVRSSTYECHDRKWEGDRVLRFSQGIFFSFEPKMIFIEFISERFVYRMISVLKLQTLNGN